MPARTAGSPAATRWSPASTSPAPWSPRTTTRSRSARRSSPTAMTSAPGATAASAELARIPSGYAVPLPDGLTAREAMEIGTAGFTAAMSVAALEERGLRPGDGPVLVTGASGGVGSTAVAILATRGHEVWAATGKADEPDRLRDLGAAGILTRDEVTAPGRPLDRGPLGGRGGHGRRGDAALRAADAADRRGGRLVGQRERRGAGDDGVPVHPARRRAAGHGLGEHGDRAAARAVEPARRPTCCRAASTTASPRWTSTRSSPRSTRSSPAQARGRWVVRVAG